MRALPNFKRPFPQRRCSAERENLLVISWAAIDRQRWRLLISFIRLELSAFFRREVAGLAGERDFEQIERYAADCAVN